MKITGKELRAVIREAIMQETIFTAQSSNFTRDVGVLHQRLEDGETDAEVISSLRDRLAAKMDRDPGITAGSIFREPKEYGNPYSGKLYITFQRRDSSG